MNEEANIPPTSHNRPKPDTAAAILILARVIQGAGKSITAGLFEVAESISDHNKAKGNRSDE
jgi:nanoRNase/pAp phosphatase (c-di-AMP/oligoRNAs hydrolase)